ncbi:ABC transporter ATP-binding protein [Actinokineospora auranticolor]|uniref:ABC-type multidrug transport system fused ATPase/permease subunit n=1 Tax=Actinokineospora auranticolor TaxID=155976 RepID=A0A2S6GMX4_9PSEU|nr:ABC transporter ATP-binding protein [Actinokineospora auranticolor]PPK66523.1 ABC-type multidrug transport system fused ATPase/permease subunit [Actinokineospora auranticolor]
MPYDDPGDPDVRSPLRLLCWFALAQWRRSLRGSVLATLWTTGLMVPPYLVSRAVDDGLRARDQSALLWWSGAIVLMGVVNATLGLYRHRTMTFVRTDASYRVVQLVVRHVVRLGAAFPRSVSAGELVSVQSSDMGHIARTMTIVGPGIGAVIAYGATAVLLWTISWPLALVVLLGIPALVLAVGPLVRRLGGVERAYREEQAAVTARAGDIAAGLRVLSGIGGKAAFRERFGQRSRTLLGHGYRVGATNSWVQAVGGVLPALFLAAVVWLAARMAASGAITVGEMVAVYGYVAVLVVPVSALVEGADDLARGLVAAGRVIAVLRVAPRPSGELDGPHGPGDLVDPTSGVRVPAGEFTALATADSVVELVDRLGFDGGPGVTWGGVPLTEVATPQLRARVLVADHDAFLFAGTVHDTLRSPDPDHAIWTAAADDVVAGLPDGLATDLGSQARQLSGGQRQRLRLARAVLADPEVLLLVEPTSAVDATTEATIATRLRATRADRTTLVVTTSPLLLTEADQVIHLVDGRVRGVGTHAELLATDPEYRDLVLRGVEEAP